MHRNASEDSAGSGGTTGSQMMGTISLVVTSEESLSTPRYEPVSGSGASDDSGSIRDRQRTNAYPGKTYGATTDMRVSGGLTVVDTHLALHPTHGTMRTRRVTVHNFGDLSELQTLSKELTAGTPGLGSRHHSCSIIDTSTEKTTAFHSNKLFAARGRKRRAGNWRSCDDINNAKRASLGSETLSPGSGGLSYNSDVSNTLMSHLDVASTPTPRLTSVTSCCSFGHTASTDSIHGTFDDRSTQSDPATGGKDKNVFPETTPRPALSSFPTFVFESDQTPVTPCEDLSFLKRLRRTKGYGSSYRGLVSGGEAPGAGGSGDPDKDSIETGSISTMQTLQFELMDDTPAWRILAEVVIPFLMAGLGMVFAGLLLDNVQHWDVFTQISEVFILVPALLGLKGNLEMTLASRLSTQANLGNMDSTAEQWKMIVGNLALTQAQAIVVGFLAALAAMILGWIPEGKFDINHGFLLCCSSVLTAAFASFVLGTVMILVVLLSRKCHVNPDNVATPIAASLGDLTTLALLSGISSIMFKAIENNNLWLAPTLLFIFLALTPLWCVVSHRNKYTHEILYSGWTPVIGAMVISSIGGLILDFAVGNYRGIAVFQPVINGVGGNLVAVQASRLSTALHRISTPGNLPEGAVAGCPNLFSTFFGSGVNSRTARVLMLLVVPGHLIFMYTIHYMHAGHTSITITFAAVYLSAATLQVVILLYIANWLVHWLWKRGNDPDNFSIPYLTAMGDLLGTGFLALAFHFLYVIGDRDADVGD